MDPAPELEADVPLEVASTVGESDVHAPRPTSASATASEAARAAVRFPPLAIHIPRIR